MDFFGAYALRGAASLRVCLDSKTWCIFAPVALSERSCLVVCGSKDWVNQSSSKKLAKLLPKGRYQEIANGGHLLNTEKPYELAQAIKEFVAEF